MVGWAVSDRLLEPYTIRGFSLVVGVNEAMSINKKLCVLVVKNELSIDPLFSFGMVGRSANVPAGGIASAEETARMLSWLLERVLYDQQSPSICHLLKSVVWETLHTLP